MNEHEPHSLKEKVARIHAAECEMVGLIERFNEVMARRVGLQPRQTQLDRIREVLEAADGEMLTPREISDITDIKINSVRILLYSRPDLFDRIRITPRKSTWRLASSTTPEPAAESREQCLAHA